MLKKFLFFSIILFLSVFLLNITYATDVVMNLDPAENASQQGNENTANSDVIENNATEDVSSDYTSPITTTTNYEDSGELTISNMINIILIVVGIVLVLLGIAIIIRLK